MRHRGQASHNSMQLTALLTAADVGRAATCRTTRGKQRYRCTECARHFVDGDGCVRASLVIKKALAVTLYSLAKASFGMLGKVCGVSRSLTYRWIKEEAACLSESGVPGDIREMECDAMWHFLQKTLTNSGSSKRWIVARGEPWPGVQVVVMLQPASGSLPRASTSRTAAFPRRLGGMRQRPASRSVTSWARRIRWLWSATTVTLAPILAA